MLNVSKEQRMGNDKTKWIFDEAEAERSAGRADYTENLGPGELQSTRAMPSNEATRALPTNEPTMIYHRGTAGKVQTGQAFSETVDPVVGWVVVIKGYGLGRSVSLGTGINSIGRDPGERVPLPFGDTLISARDHAKIIYDEDERAFYAAPGSAKNITRVNGTILANAVPLENHALVQLSKATHLRFVAFCNAEFDWSDLDRKDGDATT
jgi:hypothetical protein